MAALDYETIGGYCEADRLCDEKLAEAGLRPRWLPPELPDAIIESGKSVRELAENQKLTNVEIDEVGQFGLDVVRHINNLVDCLGTAFRAEVALDRESGNCIGIHELVGGVLAACELSDRAVSYWDYYPAPKTRSHARNGVVVANCVLMLDGTFPTDTICSAGSSNQVTSGASRLAVRRNKAVVVTQPHTGKGGISASKPTALSDLHTIGLECDPKDILKKELILPTSAATLMYSARAAQGSAEGKYAHAAEVLTDFAANI